MDNTLIDLDGAFRAWAEEFVVGQHCLSRDGVEWLIARRGGGDGLGDVPPGGGNTETGGDLGVALALTQVSQREKGLSPGCELAPARAGGSEMTADHAGHVVQGPA